MKLLFFANPATGEKIGTAPRMAADEMHRAIDAANAAWPAWREKTAMERAAVMRRRFQFMIENADDLAFIHMTVHGKPLAEAKNEILYAASFIGKRPVTAYCIGIDE